MSTDFQTQRVLSDIQSKIASLDARARRRPARPGQAIIQRAAAQLARVCGDDALAQAMETKAVASPATTTVSDLGQRVDGYRLAGLHPFVWNGSPPCRRS